MALLELVEHLVSRKGMLPSLFGDSIVNLMWVSIWFMWLNRLSTWSFLTMQMASSTYVFHQGVGMGHRVPILIPQNIPCICWLLQVKLGTPWQLHGVVCRTSVEKKTHSCSVLFQEYDEYVFGI